LTLNNVPDKLPNKPGVYILKDIKDGILYVGKAKNLKKRVKSYFKEELDSPKTQIMMKHFHSLEYIVTDTEKEALILESNLIKKYLPRYNIRLKDDKRYPYIRITNEDFPRVLITRKVSDDGSYYYGPYTDVTALRSMLKFLKSLFKIRDCKNMDGPCLNFQMNLCEAPCDGQISSEDYQKLIEKANLFFQGKYVEIMDLQKNIMTEAAHNQEYEKAAILRDQINSIKDLVERQKMEFNRGLEQDVIACSIEDEFAAVAIFSVRNGKIIGKEDYLMSGLGGGVENALPNVLSAFLKQYYSGPRQVPSELILQHHVDDEDLITEWLREKSGIEVSIKVPLNGLEYRLLKMVAKNANIMRNQQEQVKVALMEVKNYLGIPKIPRHIEAFDISNISGKLAVGSMVVFEDGAAKKSKYRRYKIKTPGPDDYAMMREVLTRRYRKLIPTHKQDNELNLNIPPIDDVPDNKSIDNFPTAKKVIPDHPNDVENIKKIYETRPDLIVIDGGKGQLNTALEVLKTLDITNIPVIGLAKEFEHIFVPNIPTPIILPSNSKALHLLMRIRDEAHRFAVSYHQKLRSKDIKDSVLDHIPGVGPKRKIKLLRHFGSIENIKKASALQIAEVKGINQKLAQIIQEELNDEIK
jgi:excinuclease ABC subunit C